MCPPASAWDLVFPRPVRRGQHFGGSVGEHRRERLGEPEHPDHHRTGTITTIPLGKKALEAAKASIMAENVHVKVDACMGPVTIRSYAQFAVSTATSDSGSTTRRSEYDGKSCPNTGKSK
ncbi:MspA family porin [Rhodococcus erythropolis]|uniref:MspA family porin n=1 Tax=Rhodococcus erythropolis TaxID=1833 RepID=UPI0030134D87